MRKKVGKILIAIVLISVIFTSLYSIYAAINEDYYNKNVNAAGVVETSSTLDKKVKSNVILDGIAGLMYALTCLVEKLIQSIFKAASGDNMFPWADLILFNAVPILDVNFLNPHSNSFVSAMQTVIKSVYGTIFGIAISFFSIAVLIMGIKLAISTIASEKAKYKQAIWDWLLGLILLFTIHFFIAFVFYLNEELVIKAEDIASTNIENGAFKINEIKSTAISDEEMVARFITSQLQPTWLDDVIRGTLAGVAGGGTAILLTALSGGAGAPAAIGIGGAVAVTIGNWFNAISPATRTAMANLQQSDNVKIAAMLLKEEAFTRKEWNCVSDSSDYWTWGTSVESRIVDLSNKVDEIKTATTATRDGWIASKDSATSETDRNYYQALIDTYDICHLSASKGVSDYSIITNLAQYFKEAAWTYGSNSWKTSKIVIQNAIMYAILVVQSLIFLIAYIKRVFYIVILAIMAPAVVVYDFFNKSIS